MDRFQAMQVFTRVVDANSFTAAAEGLGLPRTTVTTTIQQLEKLLQVRLLNRTTRRISLTPDGAAYYERCMRILADVEDAEASFHDVARGPRGRLRIDVPGSIGRTILIPAISDFRKKYPEIDLVLGLSDRPVDLVQEAVDCAIRGGELKDSSFIARRIGSFHGVTCASPAYLAAHGTPKTIDDLKHHHAVHFFSSRTGRTIDWDFVVDGKTVDVELEGTVSVNDGDAYIALGLQGMGMLQLPRYMVWEHLHRGELVEVLEQWKPAPMPISVIYLQNRHLSPKVRVFVDWVAGLFGQCHLLSGECTANEVCKFAAEKPGKTLREVMEAHNIAEHTF